ncbi:hypothetical protein FIA58_020900 [Flavobacterium jejuense]|uniref:Lipoprotein n=1 Tax=Flavobacterium jejuense TaxID=1544455 RepID=A0ABX0IZ84_9FLAO|nr:hypothetical protein [Flavobacterium jejuense]NHN28144.1 hypothetical protein [Flavobacterium jejuense]
MMNRKTVIKIFSFILVFIFINCKSELKGKTISEDYKREINNNSHKYQGSFIVTVKTEATTTGMASITYNFIISNDEAELKITSYHEPINCDGKYKILEKNNHLELYYKGETAYCKTKEPNFKLKKDDKKYFMQGLGGESTFNQWVEIEKK